MGGSTKGGRRMPLGGINYLPISKVRPTVAVRASIAVVCGRSDWEMASH